MNDAELLAAIRQAVPRGVDIDDVGTSDAYLLARVHWLLWGEPPGLWDEGFGPDLSREVDHGA